ncbi:MAG TPA: TIM barrel protein [Candidatus Hydrogenedentes bacterium]|nr:TIM barrel protein [Candidatus Hydrogenedentota bacterium]HPG67180.1 TIM barrel protein [Candidatus Hydrogenedentota bacterium]
MRLGAPIFETCDSPEAWVTAVRRAGYSAAYCPVDNAVPEDVARAYADAAKEAGIVIAEVGAWSNPMSPDEPTRKQALDRCTKQLALAEIVGARCCVNIAGSRGQQWDGPDPANLTDETFDLIVETVRNIIDAVNPTRTYYSLETMPWMYPDSADAYVRLVKAIDRKGFAVHLDPTNLVCSPQRYFNNGALITECFQKLGPHIRSCHGKDILLQSALMTHLDEVRPGLGRLDYGTFLRELSKLEPDAPLMLEHLPSAEEYKQAAAYVRGVARDMGLAFLE